MRYRAMIPVAGLLIAAAGVGNALAQGLILQQELGKAIFFDHDLSINNNQSCAACHAPGAGWTGPDPAINAGGAVYEGSIAGRFGNRKPPSAAYATPSPILHFVMRNKEAAFAGGNFWDGRATGERLGSPTAEQAQGPFLNPLEQALPDAAELVGRICASAYGDLLAQICGSDACSSPDPTIVSAAYDCIGLSVAAYEGSAEVSPFTSRYDAFRAGLVNLSKQEKEGLSLFKGKGKCANCHVLEPGPNREPALFTDFTYHNLGVPRNPDNPFYSEVEYNPFQFAWIDLGLGGLLASRVDYQQLAAANNGKMKVPTLRNVDQWDPALGDKVKAYSHNGYFKSLWQIVHFYNTRDAKPPCVNAFTAVADALAQGCWPAPEVPVNVNTKELGNLHLTTAQEDAIVAFLRALSDGYLP